MSKNNAGFSIAELIIAIFILSFGILALYGSFYSISTSADNIKPRFIATYLAQEGLEIARNIRDTNIISGADFSNGLAGVPCNSGCQMDYISTASNLQPYDNNVFLSQDSKGFYSYGGGTPTIFKRKITVTPLANDVLNVDALVTWNYKGQVFTFTAHEYLYKSK